MGSALQRWLLGSISRFIPKRPDPEAPRRSWGAGIKNSRHLGGHMRYLNSTPGALFALGLACAPAALAQEVSGGTTTTAKPMAKAPSAVTQSMLNTAGDDAKNWIHANGNYEQTRYHLGAPINGGNVAMLKPALVVQTAGVGSKETG